MSTFASAPISSRSPTPSGARKAHELSSRHVFLHLSRHTISQLKLVLPGGMVTYLLGTLARFWRLVEEESGWPRLYARISLACGVLTIGLFLYILLMMWLKGSQPNYSQWRQSGELSFVVPVLTALMVLGWPLLSFTLSQWTDLGFLKGVMASSGLYALVFGLIGLVPAPRLKRK